MKAIMWRDSDRYMTCLYAPYNEDFISRLKYSIPKYARRWVQQDRTWLISYGYEDYAHDIAEDYFDVVWLYENQHRVYEAAPAVSNHARLISGLSLNGIKRVWRVVAKDLHPDTGGRHEAFIQAKEAYDNILSVMAT